MPADPPSPPTADRLAHYARTMTIKQIAAQLGLSRTYVAALLRKRNITAVPDTGPRDTRSGPTNTPETWELILRDYRAGDSPVVLERRYGMAQATIARRTSGLAKQEGFPHRDGRAAEHLRSVQLRAADEVRYRLRTGALEAAAANLGLHPATLRAVLNAHGLLLHDLPTTD